MPLRNDGTKARVDHRWGRGCAIQARRGVRRAMERADICNCLDILNGDWAIRHDYSRRALSTGAYAVVEGPITEYHALEERQHGLEYFVVNGSRFAFSSGDLGPGFKWTRVRGSKLDVGLYVRMAVADHVIIRLELCSAGRR